MSRHASLVDVYATTVRFPDVSGFEVLELLKLRSRLAEVEGELTPAERSALEGADATFVLNAVSLFRQISEVADLEKLRKEAGALPSHWWWYLDSLIRAPVS